MNCSLEDIFNQIAESEKKTEDRKRHLTEVRLKIDDCMSKRKAVELEYHSCLKQLNTKTEELIDSRLVEKGLALRLSILQEQQDQLDVKKVLLTSQLNCAECHCAVSYAILQQNLQLYDQNALNKKINVSDIEKICETIEAEREKFSNQVKDFTSVYRSNGSGLNQRKLAARQEIQKLIESQQQLQSEMGKIYEQENKHHRVGDKQCSEEKRRQLQDLQEQHRNLVELSEKMELEKSRVSEFPQIDPEFKKLQDEVEASQDVTVTLESSCRALQLQLQQLQHQHWHYHLQRKRSSQQQQQQQQIVPPENKVSLSKIEK